MIENHDFSVYDGKTEEEINYLITMNVVDNDAKIVIANALMDIGLLSKNVFKRRMLKANWSVESIQDLQCVHGGVDLMDLMSEDIKNIIEDEKINIGIKRCEL